MARVLCATALALCKALGPVCAATAAESHLSLAGTCSDTAPDRSIREGQEMLPEVPEKRQEPELSLDPRSGGSCSHFPPAQHLSI